LQLAARWGVWKRFRPIVGLQMLSTAVAILLSAWLAGRHGAISAALGGLIGIVPGIVFVILASRSKSKSAGEALVAALRAEAAKVALMIVFLWFAMRAYEHAVAASLIGSFVATVIIFSMAVLVRDPRSD
jgi:ATP synthase protein I